MDLALDIHVDAQTRRGQLVDEVLILVDRYEGLDNLAAGRHRLKIDAHPAATELLLDRAEDGRQLTSSLAT